MAGTRSPVSRAEPRTPASRPPSRAAEQARRTKSNQEHEEKPGTRQASLVSGGRSCRIKSAISSYRRMSRPWQDGHSVPYFYGAMHVCSKCKAVGWLAVPDAIGCPKWHNVTDARLLRYARYLKMRRFQSSIARQAKPR